MPTRNRDVSHERWMLAEAEPSTTPGQVCEPLTG